MRLGDFSGGERTECLCFWANSIFDNSTSIDYCHSYVDLLCQYILASLIQYLATQHLPILAIFTLIFFIKIFQHH
jgi:hypothetical protein